MMVIRRSFGPFNMDKRPMHANNTGKDTHLVCQLLSRKFLVEGAILQKKWLTLQTRCN